ncbi:hypothetical protein CROQUDRAFT_130298 [Cronartium quercuum f. sp. fusiforme G11]|uniref:CCAAT-binding factor domain-containing protein n=1 Tax=Cronartium quercuum f. sp. fusiforme G11 TaxID=708437 RepID=A0A9P6NVK4_9BASI|nr:hypothetical protein CROQUDRAFT_130298 [Cronartium quercuum f. sp. fusiforme G11]
MTKLDSDIGSLIISKLNSNQIKQKSKTTSSEHKSTKTTINQSSEEKSKSFKKLNRSKNDQLNLNQVVNQLGGDKNDLKIIHQAEKDDQNEKIMELDQSSSDPKLANELEALVAELGLPGNNGKLNKRLNKSNSSKDKVEFKQVKENIKSTRLKENQVQKSLSTVSNESITSRKENKIESSKELNSNRKQDKKLQSNKEKESIQSEKIKQVTTQVNPQNSKKRFTDEELEARKTKEAAKAIQRRLEAVRASAAAVPTPVALPTESVNQNSTPTSGTSWLIEPKPVWYDTSYLPPLPLNSNQTNHALTTEKLTELKLRGEFVLNKISQEYLESLRPGNKNSSIKIGLAEADKSFINKILIGGTLKDKLNVLIMLISSSPLFSINHLNSILTLCKKKSREESNQSLKILINWLRGNNKENGINQSGLPNRKLKYFNDQINGLICVNQLRSKNINHNKKQQEIEFNGRVEGDEWLAIWCFEDWFKKWYFDLLSVIESISQDVLVFNRLQSVTYVYYLLNDKPEQEHNLLRLLINKLKDKDKSVCSRSSYYLLKLLEFHPNMKSILIREITNLILKIDLKQQNHHHGKYYGTITLNQIPLSKDNDESISNKLIEVYFELFKDLLGKEMNDDEEEEEEEEQNEDEIELNHKLEQEKQQKNKGKGKKKKDEINNEDPINETKTKLMSAILTGLNRSLPYSKLDQNIKILNELENLFKIIHSSTISVSIQALMILQQIIKIKTSLEDRFYRILYDFILDFRLINSISKHSLFLNLLFKSMKLDKSENRIIAFVRRIIQVLSFHQAPFICSTLVLLDDLFTNSGINFRKLLENSIPIEEKQVETDRSNTINNNDDDERTIMKYDGRKREPKYSNASSSPLLELIPLLSHYHPAVCLNVRELLEGKRVSSIVDTIEIHSLNQFLDRFIYKKLSKKKTIIKGPAIMQPNLHDRIGFINKINHHQKSKFDNNEVEELNSKSFVDKDLDEIEVDKIFFHKYFSQKFELKKMKEEKQKKKNNNQKLKLNLDNDEFGDFGGKGGSDDGSIETDIEEDEIWKAMKNSMGDLDGDVVGSEDDDDGFEDDEEFEGLVEDDKQDDEDDDGVSSTMIVEDMDDLMAFDESEEEEEPRTSGKKRNRTDEDENLLTRKSSESEKDRKKKKKKWGSGAAVFASADDYAELLEREGDGEENL